MNFSGCAVVGLAGAAAGWAAAWLFYRRRRRRDGRFLSFVAHEMNSPLASLNMTILNFIHEVFGPLPKEHEPWMHLLKEQSSRMNFLVGSFQDFVHMDYHRDFRLHPQPVNLVALLEETITGMRSSIARTGAQVETRVENGFSGDIHADRDRLQRVLATVVEHAKKFRLRGAIRISIGRTDGVVDLSVFYEGQKFASSETAEMLNLYYPVDRADPQLLPCVGLGLGLCRRLVEAHSGALDFDVDENGGSRIRVRLPAGAVPRTEPR